MQAISLCWFASRQQTSTLKLQTFGFFYAEFSVEFNEIVFFYESNRKRSRNG